MKKDHEKDQHGLSPEHTNYLVWRVMQGKKRQHDREISKAYNARARVRPETKH